MCSSLVNGITFDGEMSTFTCEIPRGEEGGKAGGGVEAENELALSSGVVWREEGGLSEGLVWWDWGHPAQAAGGRVRCGKRLWVLRPEWRRSVSGIGNNDVIAARRDEDTGWEGPSRTGSRRRYQGGGRGRHRDGRSGLVPHRQPDGGSDVRVRREDDVLLLGEARQVDAAQVGAVVVELHGQPCHLKIPTGGRGIGVYTVIRGSVEQCVCGWGGRSSP